MSNVKVFDVVYYKVDDDGKPLLREDGHYRLWREKEECEVAPNVMYIPGEDELEEHWDMDQAPCPRDAMIDAIICRINDE